MKWKLYQTPSFVKVLTDPAIFAGEKKYRSHEYGMYVFIEWILKQLNRQRKPFEADKMYEFKLSDKEDCNTIITFAQFYIRAVCNPLGGKCEYLELLETTKSKASEVLNIWMFQALGWSKDKRDINNEVFTVVALDDNREALGSMAFTIEMVHIRDYKSITIKCVACSMLN